MSACYGSPRIWADLVLDDGERIQLDRDFAARAPNRCWVADITPLRTWESWLYLVAVQDLDSRRIVGWAMADHMRNGDGSPAVGVGVKFVVASGPNAGDTATVLTDAAGKASFSWLGDGGRWDQGRLRAGRAR